MQRPAHACRFTDEGERVTLLVPRYGRGRFGQAIDRWFRPPPYRVRLDELGTFVWRRLDGERTVPEIAEELRDRIGEGAGPRLELFLRRLERGRFVRDAGAT